MVNGRRTLRDHLLALLTFGICEGPNHCPVCGRVVDSPFIEGKRGYVRCEHCGAEVFEGFYDRVFG